MSVIEVDFRNKKRVASKVEVGTEINWSEDGERGHVLVTRDGAVSGRLDFSTETGIITYDGGDFFMLPIALRTLSRWHRNEEVFGRYSPRDYSEVELLMSFGFVERGHYMVRDNQEAWPSDMVEELLELDSALSS